MHCIMGIFTSAILSHLLGIKRINIILLLNTTFQKLKQSVMFISKLYYTIFLGQTNGADKKELRFI